MTYGLIARGDRSGIAVQTLELARHVAPQRTLVVDLGERGRGPTNLLGYEGDVQITSKGYPTAEEMAWLAECRTVFTVECAYGQSARRALVRTGGRLIVQANPELWTPWEYRGVNVQVVLPTTWEAGRFPLETPVLPVPVARDRLPDRALTEVRTIYHPSAAAMLDRNGTEIVRAALEHCRSSFTLAVSGPEAPDEPTMVGSVRVIGTAPQRDYWRVYEGMDAIVIPRRYGGLCLPAQEAASLCLPIVMPDLAPQRDWLHPDLAIRVIGTRGYHMKGGRYEVNDSDPEHLAKILDRLVLDHSLVAEAHARSASLGLELDWRRWRRAYRQLVA